MFSRGCPSRQGVLATDGELWKLSFLGGLGRAGMVKGGLTPPSCNSSHIYQLSPEPFPCTRAQRPAAEAGCTQQADSLAGAGASPQP